MLACACASYVCFRPTEDISPKKHGLAAFLVGTSAIQSELTIMTYQNDLNINPRSDMRDDAHCTHWIIGGVVTLAIVIAALAIISTGNKSDHNLPQTSTTVPAPAPSTMGSDTAR